MDKQTEPVSFTEIEDSIVIPGTSEALIAWGYHITYFLEKQQKSWEQHWTMNDMVGKIVGQQFTPIFYVRRGSVLGMALVSLQKYSENILTMRVEFLSCENFFGLTKMLEVVEERARMIGCVKIEAVAHPSIARYAQKKKGFTSPAHYITKDLEPIRRH